MSTSNTTVLKPRVDYVPMETGIDADDRKRLLNGLSRALADTYVLSLKTQNLHWNVVGPLFYSVHKLSEEQYETLIDAVDEIAERIRAIGFPAPSSFQEFAALTSLEEAVKWEAADQMISDLADDHEKLCRILRDAISAAEGCDDHATADLLTEQITMHEKAAWMLRATVTTTVPDNA